MRDDKTGMPLNVAKILDAAQQREKAAQQRDADDYLAAFSKRSQEALAKQAAEKQIPPPPQNEKALVEALAAKDAVEYDRLRGGVAEALKVRLLTLDAQVDAAREERARASSDPGSAIDAEAAAATAGDLVTEPDVLTRFGKAVESAGLVGETSNAKILYLALTSRLFERPVSIAVKGVSAGGKSFTVESVLKFFPASAFFVRTGFSEKALYFSEEDFRHRFIVLFEAAGMESDYLSYVVRTLLSENRLSYELPMKTEEGLKAQVLEKEGPTGLVTTTTAARLHPENETRLLSLGVIDTKQQTKAVMSRLAAEKDAGFDYAPWQALQEWLSTGERRVSVPYARWLADKIPPVAVRLRRDFGMLLSLVRAHALLHRESRNKDEQGRIVASEADYAGVYCLVERLFAEGVEATVPATVRETVEAVRERLLAGGTGKTAEGAPTVSLTALAKELGLDKNSAHHRVRKATGAGYLTNLESRKGKPAQLVLADPLPEESVVLPEPAALARWADTPPSLPTPSESLQHSNTAEKSPTGQEVKGVGVSVGGGVVLDPTVPVLESEKTGSNGHSNSDIPLESQGKSLSVGVLEPFSGGSPRRDGYWGPFCRWPEDGLDIPTALLREVPLDRRPPLGPPGDSLDDL
jgi:hypothetical protein